MPLIRVLYTPDNPMKALTEGEKYCSGCMQHIDCCQCLMDVDVEVSEEEYALLTQPGLDYETQTRILEGKFDKTKTRWSK